MKITEIDNKLFEKCWKGYEKKGMKTMFGKRVPNCEKKESVLKVKKYPDTRQKMRLGLLGTNYVNNTVLM